METKDQKELNAAFPAWAMKCLWIINAALVILIPISALLVDLYSQTDSKMWTEAGRWATGVAITPFIALTVAYAWMLSKYSWPRGLKDPVSLAFYFGGFYLMFSIILLSLDPILVFGNSETYWDALGVTMPLGSVLLQFIALLTVIQAWSKYRDPV